QAIPLRIARPRITTRAQKRKVMHGSIAFLRFARQAGAGRARPAIVGPVAPMILGCTPRAPLFVRHLTLGFGAGALHPPAARAPRVTPSARISITDWMGGRRWQDDRIGCG